MTPGSTDQLTVLQRIAAFSAAVRGHELGGWQRGRGWAQANCIRCGAQLRVYSGPTQPEVEGPALDHSCDARIAVAPAA